jgi:hypothetical protein
MAESGFDFNASKQPFLEAARKERRSLLNRSIFWFLALMAVTGIAAVVMVVVFKVSPSGEGLGEQLVVTPGVAGHECIYYRGGASKTDAEKLAAFLKSVGFFTGKRAGGGSDVLLRKQKDAYVVGIPVAPSDVDQIDQPEVIQLFDNLRLQINEQVFPGNPVEIELCGTQYQLHGRVEVLRTIK